MALIKCPECGKEISDKATSCPNCGCPISQTMNENANTLTKSEVTTEKRKLSIVPIIVGIVILAIIIGGGVIISNNNKKKAAEQAAAEEAERQTAIYEEAKTLLDKNKADEALKLLKDIPDYEGADKLKEQATEQITYNEAMDYLNKGDYESAHKTLLTIPNYKGVEELQEEIHYESLVYQGLLSIRNFMKNPDSIKFYECSFFSKEMKEGADQKTNDVIDKIFEHYNDNPILVIHFGAQNGFGGNTDSYAICVPKEDGYEFAGLTSTLDEDKADKDEEDYVWLIKKMMDCKETVGVIDKDRINSILKDVNYSSIKIIE